MPAVGEIEQYEECDSLLMAFFNSSTTQLPVPPPLMHLS